MYEINVSQVQLQPVKPYKGLWGFAAFVINNDFYVSNVAVFTKRDGSGIRLLYPKKSNFECFHPINRRAGDVITHAVEEAYKSYLERSNQDVYETGKKFHESA